MSQGVQVRAVPGEPVLPRSSGRDDTVSVVGTPAEALYCALLRATGVAQLENVVARELPALLSAQRCRLYWPGSGEDRELDSELPADRKSVV